MYVKVKYYKGELEGYHGREYVYRTSLPLKPGDQVIAPTAKEARQRGLVTGTVTEIPAFACKEITEYWMADND